jgi:hypothetical protein
VNAPPPTLNGQAVVTNLGLALAEPLAANDRP